MIADKNWLRSLVRLASWPSHNLGRKKCAVLIDGDNVPPRLAGALIHFASRIGHVGVLEVFANFASTTHTGWATQMRVHDITGIQHFRTAAGKNATDAALIVRAMDLLHSSSIKAFILVTSDSDFSALAHRIRLSGKEVHVVGSSGAAAALRHSCTSFHTFAEVTEVALADSSDVQPDLWSRHPGDAADRLLSGIVSLGGARQWVSVTDLGEELRRTMPTFDPRAYSCRNLTDLCESIPAVQLDRSVSPPRVRVVLEVGTG